MAYHKLTNCKYCDCSFIDLNSSERANHTRWCLLNPKRSQSLVKLKRIRDQIPNEARQKQSASLKQSHARGEFNYTNFKNSWLGRKHSPETKKKISESSLKSTHRRLVKSVRLYKRKDGIMVQLDSSWEELLAKRLDELNVEWVRPPPLKWIDSSNVSKNYFPDFYLPKYELYLDPKNPHAANIQQEKITWLMKNIKIQFLYSIEEINSFSL